MKRQSKSPFKLFIYLLGLGFLIGCGGKGPIPPEVIEVALNEGWTFHQVDSLPNHPAVVPGNVHADLLRENVIPDPYFRLNETAVQWVEHAEWEYQCEFEVADSLLAMDQVELIFPGLDTYSTVWLNDEPVIEANNMFRTWKAEVKSRLQSGTNTVRVRFYSPIQATEDQRAALGYALPADSDAAEEKASIFTRKAPYHFGWDWGPRLVTCGIWKTPRLEGWNGGQITGWAFRTESIEETKAEGILEVELEALNTGNYTLTGHIGEGEITRRLSTKPGKLTMKVPWAVLKPQLWWPHGHGDPHLYDLELELRQGNRLLDRMEAKVGIRTIELVREADTEGESFLFEVNGHPMFMKGANYIPGDILKLGQEEERFEPVLRNAIRSNMNMIRVWGGGQYETDRFYELCDSMGLLVWQDFMFACSMYPGDAAFQENVRIEAEENIRRIRNHASLALWCGNNEMEIGWFNWGWQQTYGISPDDSIRIWQDYQHLFDTLLPGAVKRLDPATDYLASSPVSNWGKKEEFTIGDNHYWGVWHGEAPFSAFQDHVPRFMSEYGFQSFPEYLTVATFSGPNDRELESEVMKARQKSYKGSGLLLTYLERHFDPPANFQEFLYLNQLVQAEGIALAIKQHRIRKPYCMGTLYWQLNDAWPGPSWSGIDYAGRWKAMQFRVRDLYKPVVILPDVDSAGQVTVHLVSELFGTEQLDWEIQLIDFEGNERWKETGSTEMEADSSRQVWSQMQGELLATGEAANHFLRCRVWHEERSMGEEFLFFAPPKALALAPEPKIEATVEHIPLGARIELHSDQLVKGLFLSFAEEEGRFNDNYFDLIPGETRTVIFTGRYEGDLLWRYVE